MDGVESRDFAERQVVAIGACDGVVAGLQRHYPVKAHARRAAPHDYIAVLEQDAFGWIGAL